MYIHIVRRARIADEKHIYHVFFQMAHGLASAVPFYQLQSRSTGRTEQNARMMLGGTVPRDKISLSTLPPANLGPPTNRPFFLRSCCPLSRDQDQQRVSLAGTRYFCPFGMCARISYRAIDVPVQAWP